MSFLDSLRLLHPFWLLAILAVIAVTWYRNRQKTGFLIIPHGASWYASSKVSFSTLGLTSWILGLALLIVALARPQRVEDKREVKQKGYDLFLAVDLSASMLAEDYEKGLSRMSRWDAVYPVIKAFIQRREQDRIGMIVFSGKAYTLAPLTLDHLWLGKQLDKLKPGVLEKGTAVGDGLGLALTRLNQASRLENQERKGAFVILLTDGQSNQGALEPLAAAEIATQMKVPVYTIGAGGRGAAPMPIFDEQGNKVGYGTINADLDEPTLRKISQVTGGEFYRATDAQAIENAFQSIDRAQKIEFQSKSYVLASELFSPWAIFGFLFCAFGWMAFEGRGAILRKGGRS